MHRELSLFRQTPGIRIRSQANLSYLLLCPSSSDAASASTAFFLSRENDGHICGNETERPLNAELAGKKRSAPSSYFNRIVL